jgi:23S rRNA (guanosine2251-2'-O)-methyltransferase
MTTTPANGSEAAAGSQQVLTFVLGNETEGLSAASRDLVDVRLSIPMAHGVESLNVASAAAVIAFEVARRAAG